LFRSFILAVDQSYHAIHVIRGTIRYVVSTNGSPGANIIMLFQYIKRLSTIYQNPKVLYTF